MPGAISALGIVGLAMLLLKVGMWWCCSGLRSMGALGMTRHVPRTITILQWLRQEGHPWDPRTNGTSAHVKSDKLSGSPAVAQAERLSLGT